LDLRRLDEMQARQQQAIESLEELQEVIEKQQSLVDQTGKMLPDDDTKEATAAQKNIRAKLRTAMQKLSEVAPVLPENLSAAERSMLSSSGHLAKGDA